MCSKQQDLLKSAECSNAQIVHNFFIHPRVQGHLIVSVSWLEGLYDTVPSVSNPLPCMAKFNSADLVAGVLRSTKISKEKSGKADARKL